MLAGLAPSAVALFQVEQAFQRGFLSGGDAALADAVAMGEQLRFALLALAPGGAGVLLVTLALALMARRGIVLPLRRLTQTLGRVGQGDFTPQPPSERADEVGQLGRATAAISAKLAEMAASVAEGAADEKAGEADTRFRDFAAAASDWLWETDDAGRITFLFGRIASIAGHEPEQLIGQPLSALVAVKGEGGTTRALELDSRRPIRDLICSYETTTGPGFCRLSARAVVDEVGQFHGYRGAATDVTEAVKAEADAHAKAFEDPLTGLANRRLIEERLNQALMARAVTRGDTAVIYLNLDRFRAANDAFGHAVGDAALREIGARLRALAGPQDTVGRLGGDGFAIVQASGAQPEAAEHLCLAALQAVRAPLELEDHVLHLTASLGCAIAAPEETAAVNLLRNADVAMYRAKEDGRDTYRFHETAMTAELHARVAMERDLAAAVEADGIEVHYQPIIGAATRSVTGFEALVRWPRAGHGMIAPGDFLPLAEDTGLIVPLGANTLNTACRTAMSWPDMTIAVNLSAVHFLHDTLLKTVVRVLRESCLPPYLLELEITEAALLTAEDTALFQFDAIREMGVRLVMDRFGKGTSSLQHLKRFRFDKLKLDRTFIAGIERDPGAAEITRSVLQLADALEMHTAAEGVTSEKQAALLIAQGCAALQGKLFGKAMSADRVFKLLRSEGIMPGAPKATTQL